MVLRVSWVEGKRCFGFLYSFSRRQSSDLFSVLWVGLSAEELVVVVSVLECLNLCEQTASLISSSVE